MCLKLWKDVVPNRMAEQTSLEKELVHALDERDFWETKCDELAPQAKQLSMLLPFVRFSRFHLFGNFGSVLQYHFFVCSLRGTSELPQ